MKPKDWKVEIEAWVDRLSSGGKTLTANWLANLPEQELNQLYRHVLLFMVSTWLRRANVRDTVALLNILYEQQIDDAQAESERETKRMLEEDSHGEGG